MHQEQFTEQNGDRPNVPNVAVVLTDGVSTYDKELTIPEANAAKKKGIKVFVVGISNRIDVVELRAMSSDPQRENVTYWTTTDFQALGTITDSLVSGACATAPPVVTTASTRNVIQIIPM